MNFKWTLFSISCFLSCTYSQFITTEVQRGADVTLNCAYTLTLLLPRHISWFHMNDQHNTSQICSMLESRGKVTFHRAAKKEKYTMTLNTSMTSLTIKKVDYSDYGLYFCGEKMNNKTVMFTAVFLKIQAIQEETTMHDAVILGSVTACSILIIAGLSIKIFHLQRARDQTPDTWENSAGTAHVFMATNLRSRLSDKLEDTHVVYTLIK